MWLGLNLLLRWQRSEANNNYIYGGIASTTARRRVAVWAHVAKALRS